MPITLKDHFPLTHELAVQALMNAPWTESEVKHIRDGAAMMHHGFGTNMRNSWQLWEKTSPLHLHYRKKYGLGHADDMSGLILGDFVARMNGQPFDLAAEILYYKNHWLKQGIDPETLEPVK